VGSPYASLPYDGDTHAHIANLTKPNPAELTGPNPAWLRLRNHYDERAHRCHMANWRIWRTGSYGEQTMVNRHMVSWFRSKRRIPVTINSQAILITTHFR